MTPTEFSTALTSLDDPIVVGAYALGFTALAGLVVVVAAFVYRWYARDRIPIGVGVLLGMGSVSIWLNTGSTLSQFLGGSSATPSVQTAAITIGTFVATGFAASVAARMGDRLALESFALVRVSRVDGEVSTLVRSVGRVIAVELPGAIEDIEGYDPVAEETKDALAGATFLFPRRLTVEELSERLTTRLKTDFGVGHVDFDLHEDGSIAYLALGGRIAGLGPTLAPGSAAVAIRADPAFSASPGDTVQIWRDGPERVTTGELRAAVDDVVTVALDAGEVDRLRPDERYRLVTLPTTQRPDREFASLLRAADETMASLTVGAGDDLDGATVGSLAVPVVAVRPEDGPAEALPPDDRPLAAGDTLFLVVRPDERRRILPVSQ